MLRVVNYYARKVAQVESDVKTNYMPRFIDIIGRQFGRLIAVEYAGKNEFARSQWLCKCECGGEKVVYLRSLLSGDTKSCGCLQRELASQRAASTNKKNAKHGMVNIPEYRVWGMMIQRCTNPNNKNYKDYGGRGITVSEEWLDFKNFIKDMGRRPNNKLTIERVDNDKGYSRDNCKWDTRKVQRANQRCSKRTIISNGRNG